MITEKNPSLWVLAGIARCPMFTSMWVYRAMLSFSSCSHLNPQWVFCSGKGGSLLLQIILDQRHQRICKCPVTFCTTDGNRRWPTTSNQYIMFWHTTNEMLRLSSPLSLSRWAHDNQFFCYDCQSITTLGLSKYQILCSRHTVPKCSGSQLPALVINSVVGEAER